MKNSYIEKNPEKWREYNREYQRRRRQDPVLRAKHNESARLSMQKKKAKTEALIAAQVQEIEALKNEIAMLKNKEAN